jgi:putative hydrolase of the HAD superfamily
MSQYSTILWDTGGVLLTNGWDHNERKTVFDALELEDRPEFERRHEEANDPWEKGTIDFDEYLARTVFYRDRPFTLETIKRSIEDQSLPLADTALPILKELHQRGQVRMGQLNNESRELNDIRLERFGLKRYLSVFFCSAYVHLRKPDPAIYQLALEVLQIPASQIIFIDDRPKNAEAAGKLGMRGITYTGSAALRAELQQLGLL